ncbi:MAG: 1-deoxy-D-xylulose-5-phosphate reductoisomerase [Sulfitobacter litoralis]|jgi:1-deoxy-D-xylulose-5-phosphate reductoisomerase|uniref:1-deoxy-D-xylulose 5-phosphate reductoisomerase n=1 Tax=Sulfitobacter litoralis TaxID=335975 RepID=A0ABY0RXF2_9RHOB|nr:MULTISPECIES: 1-deoxy-D-xylulose-5-phosphate reductoisomerase [Sulfitobacter]MBQ0718307.1 1-deoxy-D-xylulose-5-phosphate reductoisomerase [Sulfitobacter litoralis]MBQ0764741.1 1-deoxy-D-xylulose-5-phosphate reductoisomerase [Sulfitobacter litoralis]MBQ0802204.1 1-deoxy-D-xylulose-5-phosphate reductoisomerase [Sulfitobacter litoralis]MCF7725968.1 1-deoxy-D-xylulose-5-phosphate reductoisomerase [Sulfitobacter sp. M22]MCF7777294.1 1-deoxy-D-xylulose-5-phosphate reductoisomerase [Sulfitobacter |tara:strand:- start:3017 stop:4189 length:1173 start_codon:yes stop_codon:yes gene_type:complete
MKKISIFGATGSIGQNTIDLIARAPDTYEVVALTGANNIAQLAKDAQRLNAKIAVTAHDHLLEDLRDALAGTGIEAAAGTQAINDAATRPADWVMSAIIGAAGLAPGVAALKQGATLALANKESLVCAGQLMLETAAAHSATMLPVDSEHSAVFQALIGEDMTAVERIIITASGGAFRDWPLEKLADATLEQASSHPNWDMGQRITIDSASMFNKAMEVIETREYFGVSPEQIEVLVHPQSMIHALVGFNDGALMAHIGPPDMRHAIGFALHHPSRTHLPVERLDLAKIGSFEFRAPDDTRWPALRLAREVMARGGMAGAVFNAAKEVALDGFVDGKLRFPQMAQIVEDTMETLFPDNGVIDAAITLDNVAQVDHLARQAAWAAITKRAG